MDINQWVRSEADIQALREMMEACDMELRRRSFVCGVCGADIPTARPLRHPAHAASCLRYVSVAIY